MSGNVSTFNTYDSSFEIAQEIPSGIRNSLGQEMTI